MFVTCSTIASLGAYTPIFFMSLQGSREGYDVQDLVLLQTFLGLAIAFGIVISGSIINRNFSISHKKLNISRQVVCQVSSIKPLCETCIMLFCVWSEWNEWMSNQTNAMLDGNYFIY